MAKSEQEVWVPLSEYSSDNFVNSYTGNFSQMMYVHGPRLEKFLDIASVNGRVLLKDKRASRERVVRGEMNLDGSLTGRGSLRWGDKVSEGAQADKKIWTVGTDQAGWTISIDGDQIREKLMEKNGSDAREVGEEFAGKFNNYLNRGLSKVVLQDKLTNKRGNLIVGKYVMTSVGILDSVGLAIGGYKFALGLGLMVILFLNSIGYLSYKDFLKLNLKDSVDFSIESFIRLNTKSLIEIFGPPLEVDRLALAEGYLGSQRLLRQPLVKFAPEK